MDDETWNRGRGWCWATTEAAIHAQALTTTPGEVDGTFANMTYAPAVRSSPAKLRPLGDVHGQSIGITSSARTLSGGGRGYGSPKRPRLTASMKDDQVSGVYVKAPRLRSLLSPTAIKPSSVVCVSTQVGPSSALYDDLRHRLSGRSRRITRVPLHSCSRSRTIDEISSMDCRDDSAAVRRPSNALRYFSTVASSSRYRAPSR